MPYIGVPALLCDKADRFQKTTSGLKGDIYEKISGNCEKSLPIGT